LFVSGIYVQIPCIKEIMTIMMIMIIIIIITVIIIIITIMTTVIIIITVTIIIIIIIIEIYEEAKPCHCPRHERIQGTVEVSLPSLFNLGAKD
jgi:hypothetical protein